MLLFTDYIVYMEYSEHRAFVFCDTYTGYDQLDIRINHRA